MRRFGVIAMVATMAAAGAGCSPAPNLLPVNDFNRPTDVAFMCFGAFAGFSSTDAGTADAGPAEVGGALSVSGRPMRACHPQAQFDPPASTTSRTFAFMPDSASGGLTMLDADNWKLIDLEQATGGYGQLPLGELPSQISVSDDGCRLISANRGSCDLTLVDPSIIVAPVIHDEDDSNVSLPPLPRTASETIQPIKGDGTLLIAAPYEAVFLPQDTSVLLGADALCSPPGMLSQAGPVGWNTPSGTPVPWYALVTYPSCDLIVLVELPSGRIVQSVRAVGDSNSNTVTFEDAGTSPVCASVDCPGQTVRVSDAAVAGFDAATGAGVDAATSGGDAGPVAPTQDAAGAAAAVDAASLVADAGSGAAGSGGAAGAGGAAGSGGAAGAGPSASGALPGNQYEDRPHVGIPVGPSGIAIVPDGTRVYVSLSNASYVGSFGLSAAGLALPGNAIYLHEGAVGSNRIRLNVQPYASTTTATSAEFVGSDTGSKIPELRYLYVIAKDGSLRVVQTFLSGQEQECETNADPLHLAPGISATTPCIAVDPLKNPRRPFAVGPGLHFPTAPVDVTAVDIRANAADPKPYSEQSVYGAHAWVLTTSGVVYLVNIDPYPREYFGPIPTSVPPYAPPPSTPNIMEQVPFENTLRDRNEISYSLTLDPSSGPPRLDVLPNIAATGPYIEPFWTKGIDLNATQLTNNYVETDVLFPKEPNPSVPFDTIDRRAVTPQTWTVTWEGGLTGTRFTGQVTAEGAGALPAAEPADAHHTVFKDGGGNFCGVGVLPGDLLTLSGCTADAQCGLGEGCLVDTTVATGAGGVPVTGLCVDPNRVDDQSAKCASFLSSVRRYEVVAAYPSELVIHPHLDELARTSLTPCQPADPDLPVSNDCIDPNDPTTDKFTCESVYPGVGNGPRCLMKGCHNDFDCRVGRTCVDFTNATANCTDGHCFCADAPPLTTEGAGCFDQLVAYQVNVGNGYLVAGSQSGLLTTAAPNADGSCSLTPTPDPRFTFRIPMDAPHCRNVPDNSFDTRIDPDVIGDATSSTRWEAYETEWISRLVGLPESDFDPCLYLGGPAGTEAQIDPTVVTPDPTNTLLPNVPRHVRAVFRNSQITFVLANIDLQPTGQFLTSFDVHGGFQAQVIQDPTTVEVSMPARIVVGPIDTQAQTGVMPTGFAEQPYLFVVDQRRLGREQGGGPTRGQLLRIHPLGFTSSVGLATGLQPIFQDYTASGGLFPIQ